MPLAALKMRCCLVMPAKECACHRQKPCVTWMPSEARSPRQHPASGPRRRPCRSGRTKRVGDQNVQSFVYRRANAAARGRRGPPPTMEECITTDHLLRAPFTTPATATFRSRNPGPMPPVSTLRDPGFGLAMVMTSSSPEPPAPRLRINSRLRCSASQVRASRFAIVQAERILPRLLPAPSGPPGCMIQESTWSRVIPCCMPERHLHRGPDSRVRLSARAVTAPPEIPSQRSSSPSHPGYPDRRSRRFRGSWALPA